MYACVYVYMQNACTCACMYMYIYIHTLYIYTHTATHARAHAHTHAHTHTHKHTRTQQNMHMHMHMRVRVYTHTLTYTHTYAHAFFQSKIQKGKCYIQNLSPLQRISTMIPANFQIYGGKSRSLWVAWWPWSVTRVCMSIYVCMYVSCVYVRHIRTS
jgi:hypothetical protein